MQSYRASETSSAQARQELEAQVAELKPASRQAKEQVAEMRLLRGKIAELQAQVLVGGHGRLQLAWIVFLNGRKGIRHVSSCLS